jgi:carboxypeptidase PM20D1
MPTLIKRFAIGAGVVLLVLMAIIVVNTLRYSAGEIAMAEPFELGADTDRAAQILSDAVQFRTVSIDMNQPEFPAFRAFLVDRFPNVHATMDHEVLDAQTPLFKWTGSDATQQPVLLAAHYDVVPVALDSIDEWVHPPYDGTLADGYIWGRGTLDNKGALIAMMSAAEHLIAEGFTPRRTVYFSFGGDEEVGGTGAQSIARHLTDQNVRLAWALDEGSFVLDGIVPGLDTPVASINLSEKGYMTLKLIARGTGGHSSMPPKITAVGRLARAVHRLEESPMPGGLTGVSAEFFDGLGPHFSVLQRALFANRWLFDPLLERVLSDAPSTNAMLRTTTAPTMLSGSAKDNVLATEASATINFRIHPRDTVDSVIAHVRQVIDDSAIEIVVDSATAIEASPVADARAQGYLDIEAAIRSTFGSLVSVPGLTIAATDARHYAKASDATYRINPFKIGNDDLVRFHGINERLSLDNLSRGIDFYGALLRKQ